MENKTNPHEIYTALMIIKMVCEESVECSRCPLKSPNNDFPVGLDLRQPFGK